MINLKARYLDLKIFKLNEDRYLELISGTYIYYEGLYDGGVNYTGWWRKYHAKLNSFASSTVMYNPVSFEEVLANATVEEQTIILFNIDMFR